MKYIYLFYVCFVLLLASVILANATPNPSSPVVSSSSVFTNTYPKLPPPTSMELLKFEWARCNGYNAVDNGYTHIIPSRYNHYPTIPWSIMFIPFSDMQAINQFAGNAAPKRVYRNGEIVTSVTTLWAYSLIGHEGKCLTFFSKELIDDDVKQTLIEHGLEGQLQ